MRMLYALLKKDLTLELRTRETLSAMVVLSVLLAVVLAIGINEAFLPPATVEAIFPAAVWVLFIISASVCVERSYDYEMREEPLQGVLLTGVSPALCYLAKLAVTWLLVLVGLWCGVLTLAVLLNVSLAPLGAELILISLLVSFGYCALATLCSGMTAGSRLKTILLPLVVIPPLFPLFFAAIELSVLVWQEGSAPADSFWWTLLVGLDLLYLVLGASLFEFVARE